MELNELEVGDRCPRSQRHGDAVAGGLGRIGGDGEELAGSSRRDEHVRRTHLDSPTRVVQGDDTAATTVLDDEVDREPRLVDGGRRASHRFDERTLDLGAGRRTTCVHHARLRMTSFTSELQPTVLVHVEDGAEGDQLADAAGTFVDQDAHGVRIAQTRSCRKRVREVEVRGVRVATTQDCGHAALRPSRRRLVQLRLRQHTDAHAVRLRRAHCG
jgi:hypothetical protein